MNTTSKTGNIHAVMAAGDGAVSLVVDVNKVGNANMSWAGHQRHAQAAGLHAGTGHYQTVVGRC